MVFASFDLRWNLAKRFLAGRASHLFGLLFDSEIRFVEHGFQYRAPFSKMITSKIECVFTMLVVLFACRDFADDVAYPNDVIDNVLI